jgi:hypothetical protein
LYYCGIKKHEHVPCAVPAGVAHWGVFWWYVGACAAVSGETYGAIWLSQTKSAAVGAIQYKGAE